MSWGPSPFRFDNYLIKERPFLSQIDSWWNSTYQDGFPGYSFIRRLKQLSAKIKSWKILYVDAIKTRKSSLATEIAHIDALEHQGPLDESMFQKRLALRADLNQVVSQELRFLRQCYKNLWINQGDENTNFFHKICSARKRRNFISELVSSEGISLGKDYQLEKEVIDYFSHLYRDNNSGGWMVSNLEWHPISSTQASDLIKPFFGERNLSKS